MSASFVNPRLVPFRATSKCTTSVEQRPMREGGTPSPMPVMRRRPQQVFQRMCAVPRVRPTVCPSNHTTHGGYGRGCCGGLLCTIWGQVHAYVFHYRSMGSGRRGHRGRVFRVRRPVPSREDHSFHVSIQQQFELKGLFPPSHLFRRFRVCFFLFTNVQVCNPNVLPMPFFCFVCARCRTSRDHRRRGDYGHFYFRSAFAVVFLWWGAR